ncbi:hypothetical protein HO133_006445 [Letharia lupina]|uniref:Uncharacterized protein n=1 Tax=Letharia lupina TaxID=560253 RepID=A0A8H6C763_9LECA|nr:uncharacterized protein HO133_006445 [Letharia lupina]KAF6218033.1 hypothetical protein HO133_006445 [Letharia lupina]
MKLGRIMMMTTTASDAESRDAQQVEVRSEGKYVIHLCKVPDVAKGLSEMNAKGGEFITVAITQGL